MFKCSLLVVLEALIIEKSRTFGYEFWISSTGEEHLLDTFEVL
jgi:hypothetical protein